MAITSVQYIDSFKKICQIIEDDGLVKFVPIDILNSDYQNIKVWLETNGNVITDSPSVNNNISNISTRQFYQQLAIQIPDKITKDQAYQAATSGYLPDFITALLNEITDPDIQFDAKMKIGSATTFDITNSTTALLAQLMGWDQVQVQAFFNAAGALV